MTGLQARTKHLANGDTTIVRDKQPSAALRVGGLIIVLAAVLIATAGCEPLPPPTSTVDLRRHCGNLSFNDTGDCVKELQRLLLERGAYFPVTGTFAEKTRNAVQRFQRVRGLPETGIVGDRTKEALYKRPLFGDWDLRTECVDLEKGAEGRCVASLQRLLNLHGAQLPGDTTYGPRTTEAVLQFQRTHNLEPVGIVGPRTKDMLYNQLPPVVPLNPHAEIHGCPGPECAVYLDRATTASIANAFDNPVFGDLVTVFVSHLVCVRVRKVPGLRVVCETLALKAVDVISQFRQAQKNRQCVQVDFESTAEGLRPAELSRTDAEHCYG